MKPVGSLFALPGGVSLDDDAFWSARDAEVATARASEAAEGAAQDRRRRAARLHEEGGFPLLALDAAAAPRETPAMAAARRFAASDRTVLVLAGGVGAGKTSAAAWLALDHGGEASAFLRATELERRGRYDHELTTWLRARSLLVIDDLGAEVLDGKGVFVSLLDEVVDRATGNRQRVVITTNLRQRAKDGSAPQFVERYGARIESRLHAGGMWADCGADDLRRARGSR